MPGVCHDTVFDCFGNAVRVARPAGLELGLPLRKERTVGEIGQCCGHIGSGDDQHQHGAVVQAGEQAADDRPHNPPDAGTQIHR